LQQVLWNLLSNAIKFTPSGGTVHVGLKRVNSQVELLVRDSGIGIDPQFVPFVFDRFRQANSATTRAHGGLGLGLNIVRQLVELHDGFVEVVSEGLGKGATFVVILPIGLPEVSEAHEKTGSENTPDGQSTPDLSRSLGGLKGLVVDDEEDTRDFVREVLERYGSEIATASSVSEALGILEKNRPDFLISDLAMPSEDGYTLISRVRALPADRGGTTPAAALTAYARPEDRRRALGAGFQVHIPKPIDPEKLVSAVASLAGRTPLWRS